MKKIFVFLSLITFLLIPVVSLAVPVSWNFSGGLLRPLIDTWTVYVPSDLRFDGEILPGGNNCFQNQILKRIGANDWDCAADDDTGASITAGDYLTRTGDDIDLDAEVVNQMKSFNIVTGSVISATNEIYQMKFARAVTINRISCSTDMTGSTATIQGDERAEATPNTGGTDVMTSALVCDEDTEATTSFANASIAADVPLNFDIDAVAATAPSRLRVHVEFTVVDA